MSNVEAFTEACYNTNSIDELISALVVGVADPDDLAQWHLSANGWRHAIGKALKMKIEKATTAD